jgi:hypothetical protein
MASIITWLLPSVALSEVLPVLVLMKSSEERAAVDDHVDLVRAVGDGCLHLGQAGLERGLARRKRRRDRGDANGRVLAQRAAGVFHHGGIDADGGDRRDLRVVVRAQGLAAERLDLARGVLALEGGEIDHGGGQFQAEQLGALLDAAGGVFGDTLFDAHLVDGADIIEQPPESGLRCACHGSRNIRPPPLENNAKVGRRLPAGPGRAYPAVP